MTHTRDSAQFFLQGGSKLFFCGSVDQYHVCSLRHRILNSALLKTQWKQTRKLRTSALAHCFSTRAALRCFKHSGSVAASLALGQECRQDLGSLRGQAVSDVVRYLHGQNSSALAHYRKRGSASYCAWGTFGEREREREREIQRQTEVTSPLSR